MQLANAELKMESDIIFNFLFCSPYFLSSIFYLQIKKKIQIVFKMVLILKTIAKEDREEL